jgi:hypothetical protein
VNILCQKLCLLKLIFLEKVSVEKALSVTRVANFHEGLLQLDLISKSGESTGLVFVADVDVTDDPNEFIGLEYAKKYGADAVYFRRFENRRPPIPQIYIYDNTDKEFDAEEIGELHRKLWNSGQVPLFFIFLKTEVKIFNCFKQPNFDENNQKITSSPLETIKLAAEIEDRLELEKIKAFSAKQFDNGSFWQTSEHKYKDEFKLSDSAYEKLLTGLKQARREIIKRKILPEKIAQKLLVMSILVKYLEEREDDEGNRVFPKHFFKDFAEGAENFVSILKTKGACLKLFEYLSSHFNGEIFRWDDVSEREYLLGANLNLFADFLEGKIEGQQYVLWRLYSFNDLPIELISNIYEEFLESKEGVVYTPPYLVNFLIDESMPLKNPRENFKVLDPACGSGVFLVAAYRRIIYWWRLQNNRQIPDLATLKKLLSDNIYGVDIHDEAVRLTIFSLSLALCDELSPKVIWEELKFDNLIEKNLFDKDFFELIYNKSLQQEFDLIIGNPPFFSKLNTYYARKIEAQRQSERVKIPDNQIALLFLDQAIMLCKKNALLCLIQPSGPFLYNNNSLEYRRYFLECYNVFQIIDFTHISRVLFGANGDVATLALFATNGPPTKKDILHITVRRTKPIKEKLYFELDKYDFHYISNHLATTNRLIWKSNFLGGGRIHHLISRLSHLRKLGEYLNNKQKNEGWFVSEGFIVGNREEINILKRIHEGKEIPSQYGTAKLSALEKRYKRAKYLTGKRTLPTVAFTEEGIDESRIHILDEEYFTSIRREEVFKGPILLIKEIVGKNSIPIALRDEDISYKHRIIGVNAPKEQFNYLKKIEKRIKNNKLYLFYIAGFSGEFMINKSTSLLKEDIDNLPYPENERELELSNIEKILVDDVLDYMLEFRRKGESSKILRNVKPNQLIQFGELYCEILNSVYDNFKPYPPIETESFICYPFYYQKRPEIEIRNPNSFEENLNKLAVKTIGKNLRITRVLRIYKDNIIYLIKPKQLRYWLKSIAVRDADETFADLVAQGY